jgi:hypothetical protein
VAKGRYFVCDGTLVFHLRSNRTFCTQELAGHSCSLHARADHAKDAIACAEYYDAAECPMCGPVSRTR